MPTLRQSELEACIADPVFAVWLLFGVELDVFQAVRLRYMWWVPELIDDSGISTGKTEILWVWAQLRAILLPQPGRYPHRIIGIYYLCLFKTPSAHIIANPNRNRYFVLHLATDEKPR